MANDGAPAASATGVATGTVTTTTTGHAPNTPTSSTPPQTTGDWTTGFNDEMRGYIQNKGFKSPVELAESYRNFEKLQGAPQDRILKLPEKIDLATPEGRAIFERLGAPKDAKEYQIDIPKEHGDQKLAEWLRDVGHKNGLTHAQMQNIVKSWNETTAGQRTQMQEQIQQKVQSEEMNLKKEWGAALEQNVNIARNAARALGIEEKQINALQHVLGYDGVMKLMHKFGQATGEHAYVGGQGSGGSILPPNQAQAKINQLKTDPGFAARLMRRDAEAVQQWDQLHKMAFPS